MEARQFKPALDKLTDVIDVRTTTTAGAFEPPPLPEEMAAPVVAVALWRCHCVLHACRSRVDAATHPR